MFSKTQNLYRLGIATALAVLIILVGPQPAFSQAGVTNVIVAELPFTAGTFDGVTFDPSAIPGADAYEVCFFDSADIDFYSCIALNPEGWDVRAVDLEDLVEGRIYGCFIRAHFDQSGETTYSDTVFSTWGALSHDIMISNSAPSSLGTADDEAGARAHNYPNPFNPNEEDTKIVLEPDHSGSITVLIYDLFGHLVYEGTDADAGNLSWDGRNGRGELVASGGYICVLKVGGKVVSRHKIAVIK